MAETCEHSFGGHHQLSEFSRPSDDADASLLHQPQNKAVQCTAHIAMKMQDYRCSKGTSLEYTPVHPSSPVALQHGTLAIVP